MQRKDEVVKTICAELEGSGLIEGYAYDHFRESQSVPPPFVVYRRVAYNNFSADGIVYHHGNNVDLELYAEDPDSMSELMREVESLLDNAGLFYNLSADTVYIESEDLYESLYEI